MNGLIVLRNAPGSPEFFGNHLASLAMRNNGTFTCGAGNITTNMTTNADFLIYCNPSLSKNLSSLLGYVKQCEVPPGSCRNWSCAYGSGSSTELTQLCAANDRGSSLVDKTCQFGLLNYYQVCLVCCVYMYKKHNYTCTSVSFKVTV